MVKKQEHGARSDAPQQIGEQVQAGGEAQFLVGLEDLAGTGSELAAEAVCEGQNKDKAGAAWIDQVRGQKIKPCDKNSAHGQGDKQNVAPVHREPAMVGADVAQEERTRAEGAVAGYDGYERESAGINAVLRRSQKPAEQDKVEGLQKYPSPLPRSASIQYFLPARFREGARVSPSDQARSRSFRLLLSSSFIAAYTTTRRVPLKCVRKHELIPVHQGSNAEKSDAEAKSEIGRFIFRKERYAHAAKLEENKQHQRNACGAQLQPHAQYPVFRISKVGGSDRHGYVDRFSLHPDPEGVVSESEKRALVDSHHDCVPYLRAASECRIFTEHDGDRRSCLIGKNGQDSTHNSDENGYGEALPYMQSAQKENHPEKAEKQKDLQPSCPRSRHDDQAQRTHDVTDLQEALEACFDLNIECRDQKVGHDQGAMILLPEHTFPCVAESFLMVHPGRGIKHNEQQAECQSKHSQTEKKIQLLASLKSFWQGKNQTQCARKP